MKCPSCKAKIRSSDFQDDPWSKVDKHGEGFYSCPSCGKNLVHRWVFGPSFGMSFPFSPTYLLFTIVLGVVFLVSEFLAFVMLWLIAVFVIPGESVSEIVTFFLYTLVGGFAVYYYVQPVEVNSR